MKELWREMQLEPEFWVELFNEDLRAAEALKRRGLIEFNKPSDSNCFDARLTEKGREFSRLNKHLNITMKTDLTKLANEIVRGDKIILADGSVKTVTEVSNGMYRNSKLIEWNCGWTCQPDSTQIAISK